MTRKQPLWQQAGTYPASTDRAIMAALWPTGGAIGARPAPVANTMQINIPPGICAVPLSGGNGVALCQWDAAELVTLAAAPPSGQTRIDLVICQVRDNAIDAGANNDFIFTSVTGIPAATNPARPATPANAYVVCTQTVPGAVANLNGLGSSETRTPLGPGSGIHGRWARNGAFTIGNSGNLIQFDTAVEDTLGMLWTTWGGLIIPFPGRWAIAASIAAIPPNVNQSMTLIARVNQANLLNVQTHASLMSWGCSGHIAFTQRFAAADLLDIQCWVSGPAWTGAPGGGNTWLTADFIGP